jgi:hypothetical protein
MSDRTALILGGIIAALIALDVAFGGTVMLFLMRRLAALVEWLQFWR